MTTFLKITKTQLILFLLSSFLYGQQLDPNISTIISHTNIDSLSEYVKELTGIIPVTIDDTDYVIASRCDTTMGNQKAAIYLYEKLASFGLNPQFEDFDTDGRNVLATQTGIAYPNQKYILCAHYDNMPQGQIAPGADDNASGTAAVLEAARILSKYTFSYTLVYALWDLEELGLVGSGIYVDSAIMRGDTILGAINLDMISWDSNNDMIMNIHTRPISNSLILSDTVIFINTNYNIGLNPIVKNPGSTSSDHAQFWYGNYSALMLIESFSDFNSYYHTTSDVFSTMNLAFFHKMSMLAIGTVAVLAGVQPPSYLVESSGLISDYNLFQNYPNPFNPTTTIRYKLPEASQVCLEIFDIIGRRVATLVNSLQPSGEYSIRWNASNHPDGIYICRLMAGNFLKNNKMVLMK